MESQIDVWKSTEFTRDQLLVYLSMGLDDEYTVLTKCRMLGVHSVGTCVWVHEDCFSIRDAKSNRTFGVITPVTLFYLKEWLRDDPTFVGDSFTLLSKRCQVLAIGVTSKTVFTLPYSRNTNEIPTIS